MRKILFIFLIFILAQACTNNNTETDYVIIIESSADSIIQKSALQLKDYWVKICNKEITVLNKLPQDKKAIYLGRNFASPKFEKSLNSLKEDGFIISINNENIYLAGKTKLGTLYAVNTLLEEHLGCIKLSASEEFIPKKATIKFENSFKKYDPAFNYRRILFKGQKDQSFREWYKLENLDDWGMFVHTFKHLIPPAEYFKQHPEYFSLINGRRLQDAQLCLSNEKVINTLINNLGEEMKKQPEKNIWSVSQNDAINYCECKNCKKMYNEFGSVSGAYIHMANKIAKAFPDKQISTLAYQFTRSAPTNIKPLPNVNIMFCSIECNRSMPLELDKRSKDFVKDMQDWSKLTNNIFVWDYVVQFKNYLTPFPNFSVLQPNIQFFKNNNVEMMFQQGSNGNWSDMSELKQYLIAKLLWNPEANIDSLQSLFMNAYYGKAAKFITQYLNTTNEQLQLHSEKQFLNIYGFPSDYTNSFLSPKLMLDYLEMMNNAEQAVADNSIYLNRVKRVRLPIDFAFVDIAVNNNFTEMPAIIIEENGKEINPLILQLLNNMEDIAAKDASIKINERGFEISDYKDYVLNKLDSKLKNNKLKNAKIVIESKYSNTYDVGGEKALNDNLFGPLDYHHNWLGFQGEDMIVNIDLHEKIQISEIQMNFLKAVNSWIFLPKNISVEYSMDGKNYQLLKTLHGDINDQNYLVKSIPFVFNFKTVETRYLRINAESMKTCPQWHRGFGKPSWIFTDEIIVN
jgi:hypothetical protein